MLAPTPQGRGTARLVPIPAPVLGWNTRDPLASMKPGFACILDNFVIEKGSPRVRLGYREWATGLPDRVDGLLAYQGASDKLFAASDAGIYDITSGGAVGAAAVSSLTSARWDGINVEASGGRYLLAWNNTNTERTYDGSSWANWTATGITGRVGWGMVFKSRVFVGNPTRLSFYYGGAGAIAGAFTEFPLQGIALRGGFVVAATTLSIDGGDGLDDLAVFITSEGEAIVYQGTDPSSTSTWALVGRWRIPRPLGAPHRCVMRYGGDALLMTDQGVVPLSAFRTGRDVSEVVEKYAVTSAISPTWREIADDYRSSSNWGISELTRLGLVVMNTPWGAANARQIVLSENNAITRWAGIPAAVWAEGLGGRVFAGGATDEGVVYLYGEDIEDNDSGIRAEGLTAFSALGSPGRTKRCQSVQPIFQGAIGVELNVSVPRDWEVPVARIDALGLAASAPNVPTLSGGAQFLIWDVGNWDEGLWAGTEADIYKPRLSTLSMGQAFAVRVQMVTGYSRPAWLANNLIVEAGGPTP